MMTHSPSSTAMMTLPCVTPSRYPKASAGGRGWEVRYIKHQCVLLTTVMTGAYIHRVNDPIELARRLAPVMKALSDENRLAILLAVAQQDRSVTELTAATGLAQTLVSHHLKSLRDNGLVTVTAHGRSNVYSLCCAAVADPLEMLAALAKDPSNSVTTGA
jgi:DNA-binding transcriptional ArsR family regulator